MKKRELTIPTILGMFIAIGGIFSAVWLTGGPARFLAGAAPESVPQSVKVTNISDTTLSLSWTTDKSTSGFLEYTEDRSGATKMTASDDRDQEKGSVGSYQTHHITLKGLTPTATYKITIGSGTDKFDQQNITTGPTISSAPTADVAFGQVVTSSGDVAEGAIVYMRIPGGVEQSTLVKSSGNWVIPVAIARTTDLSSFVVYDKKNTNVAISAQAGVLGTANVIASADKLSPVTTISLNSSDTANISTQVDVLPTEIPVSKFSTELVFSQSSAPAGLKLISPKPSEEVNSQRPVIIGEAEKNTEIQIEINSNQPIVAVVTTNSAGKFTYNVPQDLEPGTHTVTITTTPSTGLPQKITRTFTVLALNSSVNPAFSATGSAQITIAPSPTPTMSPTKVPVQVFYPSTASGTPESGDFTSTLILVILGVGLLLTGGFIYGRT